jgi:hypothetical protein
MKSDHKVTADRLREVLVYDPETGEFRWRIDRNNVVAGTLAGSTTSAGYISIRVDGIPHQAHRLAWLYVHGEWPQRLIDHRNGVTSDNRIANLRPATRTQNGQNIQGPRVDNASGFLGVSWSARCKRWRAAIRVDGDKRHLGYFDTPEEASAAYLTAKAEHHPYWARRSA